MSVSLFMAMIPTYWFGKILEIKHLLIIEEDFSKRKLIHEVILKDTNRLIFPPVSRKSGLIEEGLCSELRPAVKLHFLLDDKLAGEAYPPDCRAFRFNIAPDLCL